KDFFDYNKWAGDIITNPPYKIALPFLKHALNIINTGSKVALFLRLLFLEGIERGKFFKEFPPKKVYVSSARLNCAKNGDFKTYSKSTAMAFAWFVWEKNFKENTIIDWI
ncbi:MAG: NAD(P)-dependent oxidoreductase, partial [Megamonas funiformis]|nr:NAD(P)-dependent oxidoreductase [Megamonas funiformis]